MPSLPIDSINHKPDGAWVFAWIDTGNGPYRVVLDGSVLATVDGTSYEWTGNGYRTYPPPLEIVEDGEQAESQLHSPYVRIEWGRVPGAAGYGIEQRVASAWVRVGSRDDTGESTYYFQTGIQEDGSLCELRVSAEDAFGNPSSPVAFSKTVVRCPPPPDDSVQASYAPGFVTISFR